MDPTSITLPRRNLCRFAREIIFQEATREFSRLLLLQQRLSSPRSKLDDYSTLRCSDQEACLQRVEWKKKKHRTNAMDSFSLSLKYYKVSLRIRRARTITIGPPKIRCREIFSAETDPKKAKFLTIFLRTPRAAPRLSEVEGCCAWWRSWPSLSTLPSSAFTFAVRPRCGADRIAGSRAKNRGGAKMAHLWLKNSL